MELLIVLEKASCSDWQALSFHALATSHAAPGHEKGTQGRLKQGSPLWLNTGCKWELSGGANNYKMHRPYKLEFYSCSDLYN